jgi:hypothetical protein
MPARRLLLLDATRVTAYQWRMGRPHREAEFLPDESGLAAFGEYLKKRRSSLFYLVADVAEEGFQVEEVPYVHGRDRDSLIKRKLAQYYYGTPLSTAISLGRSTEGRRDERLLFSGLSGYAQFEPWLLAMRQAETQLAGVYAMPMILADAVTRQVGDTGQALVISITRAGLRQTFFDRGQLRFSRLTPISIGSIEETSTACATEADKIFQYLAGQRMIARDTPLQTLILAHPSEISAIGNRCRNTEKSNFQLLDLVALAQQHGLAKLPGDSNSEELFLHTLVRQTPRQQFAPPEDRHFYRIWQIRHSLRAFGLGVLALCLLVTIGKAFQLNALSEHQDELKAQIEISKRRYDDILQTLPKIPISTENLRALTDRSDLLARRSPGIEPALQHLSRALGQVPKVELTRLDWKIANRAEPTAGTSPAQNDTAPGDGSYVLINVQAQLPLAMVSDHRAQIDTVNNLIESLKTDGIDARVVSLPFETESGKLLKSGTETATQIEPPKFAFRMVQKL